jgi:hypothetical protein
MQVSRFVSTFTLILLIMTMLFNGIAADAQQPTPESSVHRASTITENTSSASEMSSSSTEVVPSGLTTIRIGQLEMTPSRSTLVISKANDDVILYPMIRFKIKNVSASDVKVILFRHSLQATDDLGSYLFNNTYMSSGGLLLSDKGMNDFNKAFDDERGKFITLSPRQIFECQLVQKDWPNRINDKNGDFLNTHRPKTITISGTIGVMAINNSSEIRAFSFSDVPVQVSTQ